MQKTEEISTLNQKIVDLSESETKLKQDHLLVLKESKDSKSQVKFLQKKVEGLKESNQLLESLVDELNNKCME